MAQPCPFCKSPSRGNPCWYYLDYPHFAKIGGDPPCTDYDYDHVWQRKRARSGWWLAGALVLMVVLAVGAALLLLQR